MHNLQDSWRGNEALWFILLAPVERTPAKQSAEPEAH